MRIFIGHRLEDPDGEQFLVTLHEGGYATFATRPNSDPRTRWSAPEPLTEEPVQ